MNINFLRKGAPTRTSQQQPSTQAEEVAKLMALVKNKAAQRQRAILFAKQQQEMERKQQLIDQDAH